jgi:hypothetical protein
MSLVCICKQMKGSMQVMGKFAPADVLRKLDEKCKSQIQEIDACEDSLANGAKVYNAIREDLLRELVGAINKLEDLEKRRLEFVTESLSRYCMACQGMLDHVGQLTTEQSAQSASLDFEAELEALRLESVETQFAESSLSSDGRSPTDSDTAVVLMTHIAVAEKLRDSMDSLKVLIQRATGAMAEVADLGKVFSKQISKVADRQLAPQAVSKGGALSDTAALLRGGNTSSAAQSLVTFMATFESPSVRKAWEAAITSLTKFSEGYQTASEVMVEKCCSSADTLQRRLEASRRELADQLSSNVKKVDAAKGHAARVAAKLKRCRRDLKDLKESGGGGADKPLSIQSVTEENTSGHDELQLQSASAGGDSTTSPVVSPVGDEDNAVAGSPQRQSAQISEAAPTAPAPLQVATEKEKSTGGILTPIGKVARSASVRLPSIASLDPLKLGSAIGAAVGLESSSDRKVSRIAALEDEVKSLAEAEVAAAATLKATQESCSVEIQTAIDNAKQNLSRDLLNIKMVLQILMDCHRLCQEICQRSLLTVQKECEGINIDNDFEYFTKRISTIVYGVMDESISYSIDFSIAGGTKPGFFSFQFPPEENFIPIQNAAVSFERQNSKAVAVAYPSDYSGQVDADSTTSLENAGDMATSSELSKPPPLPEPERPHSVGVDLTSISAGQLEVRAVAINDFSIKDSKLEQIPPAEEHGSISAEALVDQSTIQTVRRRRSSKRDKGDREKTTQSAPVGVSPNKQLEKEAEVVAASPGKAADQAAVSIAPESVKKSSLDAGRPTTEKAIPPSPSPRADVVLAERREAEVTPAPSPSKAQASEDFREDGLQTSAASTSAVSSPSGTPLSTKVEISPVLVGPVAPKEESYLSRSAELKPADAEKILESFSCAIYPKRGMLTHGRY